MNSSSSRPNARGKGKPKPKPKAEGKPQPNANARPHPKPKPKAEGKPQPNANARPHPKPKGGGRNVKLAVLTGATLGALVVGLLFVGSEAFFGLAVVVMMLAQAEFYRATRGAGHNPAAALGLVGGAILLVGVFFRGESAAGIAIVGTLACTFIWYMSLQTRTAVVTNIAITMFGVLYIPLLGSFIGLLTVRSDGRGVTIVAIGAAAVYDIFAYVGGSKLGRHPMAPSISPNKTWEGAAVATVATIGTMAWVAPRLGPWSLVQAAILGAAVAVVAPIGDLVESLIKRDLGIKDMGTIFPGHGGALDRIDAILFVAPTVYLSLKLFGLGA